ncbi:hypothetical protein BD626DRAFT_576421 [Schizophyllum amplum]|uniref:Uncharacterized protein n=1 Tax=Schizophyllum amplum TaxID=97359 RepID=A0A550BTN9_9AGAR|nr:hypothetical protein BD626DRAFT_576421 [Auriculariopsis ampla]
MGEDTGTVDDTAEFAGALNKPRKLCAISIARVRPLQPARWITNLARPATRSIRRALAATPGGHVTCRRAPVAMPGIRADEQHRCLCELGELLYMVVRQLDHKLRELGDDLRPAWGDFRPVLEAGVPPGAGNAAAAAAQYATARGLQ